MSDLEVVEDGIVGEWHRWVVISVASAVLFSYIIFATINMIVRFTGLGEHFGFVIAHDPFDPHLLLIAVPWGILRGEMGYQKDLKINGPKAKTAIRDKPGIL